MQDAAGHRAAHVAIRCWPTALSLAGLAFLVVALVLGRAQPASAQPSPPATFAGEVAGVPPKDGLSVRAEMGGLVCGLDETFVIDGVMWYRVHVNGYSSPDHTHCGGVGNTITFFVDGRYAGTATWDSGLTVIDLVVVQPTPQPTARPKPPATGGGDATPTAGQQSGCRTEFFPPGNIGCGDAVVEYNDPASPRDVTLTVTLEHPEVARAVRGITGAEPPDCGTVEGRKDCRSNRPLYEAMVAFIEGGADLFPGAEAPVAGEVIVSRGSWRWRWSGDSAAPAGDYPITVRLLSAKEGTLLALFEITVTIEAPTATPSPSPADTPTNTPVPPSVVPSETASPTVEPTPDENGGGGFMAGYAGWVVVLVGGGAFLLGILLPLFWFLLLPLIRRASAPNIFLSYRRGDAAGWTRSVFERLAAEFGDEHVFQDVVDIEGGVDWVDELHEQVASCDVLVALIGKRWVGPQDDGTRRIDRDDDWVRLETARALSGKTVVIPLLVDGMNMGDLGDLPEDLARLRRRNAISLYQDDFDGSMVRLIRAIRNTQSKRRKRRKKPSD